MNSEKVHVPALSAEINTRLIMGAAAENMAVVFHLETPDQRTPLDKIKMESYAASEIFASMEEARQWLHLAADKEQFDKTASVLVTRCSQRGDAQLAKAVSAVLSDMAARRSELPDKCDPAVPREPDFIPRPAVTTQLTGDEPVILPEPGLPFTIAVQDASWFRKDLLVYMQLADGRAAPMTVFSVSDAQTMTLTHKIAECTGLVLDKGARLSVRNEYGEWRFCEYADAPTVEPATEHWEWRIWKTTLSSQKNAGWKSTSASFPTVAGTVPCALVHEHVLYVASISPAYQLEVRTYACAGSFRQPDRIYSIPLETQTAEPLKLSVCQGMLAVLGTAGVHVIDEDGHCFLHTIVHPALQAAQQRMITSCLLRSHEELILGTSLGCIWSVCPTEPLQKRFYAMPKVLPILSLAAEGAVVVAGTVNEILLMPDEVDFVRGVSMARPVDFVLRDRLVSVFSKYGYVAFIDAQNELEPSSFPAPEEPPQTPLLNTSYPALCLSEGEGRTLTILYPDARVKVIKMM